MNYRNWGLGLAILLSAAGCGQDMGGTSSPGSERNFETSQNHGGGQPVRGAIFTTDPEGEAVNQNHFAFKEDVHLNGGPRHGNAPRLSPDGAWYYQVTDPGCQVLLAGPAGDDVDVPYTGPESGKVITVEDGFFTDLMQLAPFNDTPNPGGVYKVWATPAEYYDESMTAPGGCFGFVPRFSKMDTFKVDREMIPPPPPENKYCISGYKLFDPYAGESHVNGEWIGVSGIRVVVKGDGVYEETYTSGLTGSYEVCGLKAGEYKVKEVLPPWNDIRWIPVGPVKHQVSLPGPMEPGHVTGINFVNACFIANGIDDWDAKGRIPLLIQLWDQLEASSILAHPLIVYVFNEAFDADIEAITTGEELRAFLLLQSDDKLVLLAQGVMNLQLNLLAGEIDADAKVQLGDSIVTAGVLLATAAEAALDPSALDPTSEAFKVLFDAVVGIYLLQDEPCPVVYPYDD